MTLALIVLLGSSLIELLIFTSAGWRFKRILAAILVILLGLAFGWLIAMQLSGALLLLLIIQLYRGFNLLRIVQGRMHDRYLKQVTLQSSVSILTMSFGLLAIWSFVVALPTIHLSFWSVLAVLQLMLSSLLATFVFRGQRRSALLLPRLHSADRDLPSISVCIPARNETDTLEQCLRSLIASDYPKLEILVLDDESHDRTPDIIRSFAHDGVRFIKGKQPPVNWLAKNWAYRRLVEEASGDLIVFAGVDIRFESGSLRQLILAMNARKLDMISCLPLNSSQRLRGRQTTLIQPVRYGWEFIISQLPHGRPAVLSSCWVARRSLLARAGGFDAVRRAVLPEIHFARVAADRYTFAQAGRQFGLSSDKPSQSQLATAIRTRYPQLHRRPEAVLILSSLQSAGLLLTYATVVATILQHQWLFASLAALAVAILHDSYYQLVKVTYGVAPRRALLAFPIAIILDLALRHLSMWRYEFGQVIWKERDIASPVMHVEPHLPRIY